MKYVSIPKQQNQLLRDKSEGLEHNYREKDEIRQFLAITEKELSLRDHVLFHVLIYTGTHKGELLALGWDDIDFDASSSRLAKTLFHTEEKFLI